MAAQENIFWELISKDWAKAASPEPFPEPGSPEAEDRDMGDRGIPSGDEAGDRRGDQGGSKSKDLPDGDRGYKDITSKYGEKYRRFDNYDWYAQSKKLRDTLGEANKKRGAGIPGEVPKAPKKKTSKTPGAQHFKDPRDIYTQLRGDKFALDIRAGGGNLLPEELDYPECLIGDGIQYGYIAAGTDLVKREPKDRNPRRFRLHSFTEEKYGTMAIYREIK